jgi:beta-lactamase regulating signal transducer with metallopeptidase domain
MSYLQILSERWGATLWSVSWQITCLVLLIWAISLLCRKASPQFRYGLWCIVLVRLCLPFEIALPTGLDRQYRQQVESLTQGIVLRVEKTAPLSANAPEKELPLSNGIVDFPTPLDVASEQSIPEQYPQSSYVEAIQPALQAAAIPTIAVAVESSPAAFPLTSKMLLVLAWLGLVLLSGLAMIWRMVVLRHSLRHCSPVERPELEAMLESRRRQLGIGRRIRLRYMEMPQFDGPAVVGFFNHTMLLPRHMADEWELKEIEPIMMHELAHIKRGDLWINALQVLFQLVYFFHPLVWLANWQLRQLREEACDDFAIHHIGAKPGQYSRGILRVIEGTHGRTALGFAGLGFLEKKSSLAKRIIRIMSDGYRSRPRLGVASTVALIIVGALSMALASERTPLAGNEKIPNQVSDSVLKTDKRSTIDAITMATPVTGYILMPDNTPADSATVVMTREGRVLSATGVMNNPKYRGGYSVRITNSQNNEMSASGNYTIWAKAPACAPGHRTASGHWSVDIKLAREATAEGIIAVNVTGERVEGATVSATLKPGKLYLHDKTIFKSPFLNNAVSDASGRFKLEGLFCGEFYNLVVSASGRAPKAVEFEPKAKMPLRIVLDREAVVSGQVLLASSTTPVPGATVELTTILQGKRVVVSDASGNFRIGGLSADFGSLLAWTDKLVPQDNKPKKLKLRAGKTTESPSIQLVMGAKVAVHVIDGKSQQPITAANIILKKKVPWSTNIFKIRDSSGVVISPLVYQPSGITVKATDYFFLNRELKPEVGTAAIQHITYELSLMPDIAGIVTDEYGNVVKGATITNLSSNRSVRYYFSENPGMHPRTTTTSATGYYQMKIDRNKSKFDLCAYKVGYATATKRRLRVNKGDIDFTLTLGATLSGLVVVENGELPGGVEVTATYGRREKRKAAVDGSGRYRIETLSAGSYKLQASSKTHISKLISGIKVVDGSMTEVPDLLLVRAMKFGGRVVAEGTKNPIPGVKVSLTARMSSQVLVGPAMTDEDGEFLVEPISPGEYQYQIEYPKNTEDSIYLFTRSWDAPKLKFIDSDLLNYEITAKLGALVKGKVIAADGGEPLAGASINLSPIDPEGHNYHQYSSRYGRSDRDGSFSVAGVAGRSGVQVNASVKGYAPGKSENVAIRAGESVEGVVIKMRRGGSISGQVVDDDGKPVSKIWAQGYKIKPPQTGTYSDAFRAKTDKEGRFETKNLNLGVWRMGAGKDQHSSDIYNSAKGTIEEELREGKDLTDVVIVYSTKSTFEGYLSGVLLDSNEKPIPRQYLSLTCWDPDADEGQLDWTERQANVQTDKKGKFHIKDIPKGKYTISAYSNGYSQEFKSIKVPQKDCVLRMKALGGISGRVVGEYGEEVTVFQARVEGEDRNSSGRNFQTFSSKEGKFEFENIIVGSYRIKVTADNYVSKTSEAIEVEAGEITEGITIHLTGGSRLQVRVVSAKGHRPISMAKIYTQKEMIESRQTGRMAESNRLTGEDGVCEMKNLLPGEMDIYASHPDYEINYAHTEVKAGKTGQVEIALSEGGSIKGHVQGKDGKPIVNAYVTANHTDQQLMNQTGQRNYSRTDEKGHYRIDHLPPGKYRISISMSAPRTSGSQDYRSQSKPAEIAEGQTTVLDFTESAGRVFGLVTRGSQPVGNAQLRMNSMNYSGQGNHFNSSASSDDEGRYEFNGVPAGEYSLTLYNQTHGYQTILSVKVTLSENEQTEVNMAYPEGGLSGTVVSGRSGQPVAGADITCQVSSGGGENNWMPGSSCMTKSDSEGNFSINNLAGGKCHLMAKAKDYGQAELDVDLAPGETLEGLRLELPKGGNLEGKVTLFDQSMPKPQYVHVTLIKDGAGVMQSYGNASANEGTYKIEGISTGDYLAVAGAEGLAISIKPVHITAGQTTQLDFVLQAVVDLTLLISGPEGEPIGNAQCYLTKLGPITYPPIASIVQNAGGNRYTITQQMLGNIELEFKIKAEGYQETIVPVDLSGNAPGSKAEINITMQRASQ